VADALMVTSSFLPGRGGIESYLAELCDELAPRIAVLAAARREGRALPGDLPYLTIPFPGRLWIPGPRAARWVIEHARRLQVDRVLFGTPWPLLLMAPKLRDAGLSYGVIVHGAELLVPAAVPVVRKRLAAALADADLIVAVSDFTARKVGELLLAKGFGTRDVPVLRARVDLDRFKPATDVVDVRGRHRIPREAKIVLCFGRLVRRKGLNRLIEVLPAIRAAVGDVVLVVAGTGPELRRLRRLAAKQQEPVVFTGRVSDDDAPSYYAAADVFVLPVVDRYRGLEVEGLGVVLLEAAASGVPSVTGRSGGTPEAVIHGRTGFVVDAADASELSGGIIELLNDDDLARSMGDQGRAHVAASFSRGSFPEELMRWLGKGRSI
jgi:phosphatidylinositol alpha-1,6-mannosyltransferase